MQRAVTFLFVVALSLNSAAAVFAEGGAPIDDFDALVQPAGACSDLDCDVSCDVEAGCGSCGEIACCPPAYRFYAGAELIWLEPHLNNGDGLVAYDLVDSVDGRAAVDNINSMTFHSVEFDKDTAVRAWLGVEDCTGLGTRVRYFYYNQDIDPMSLAPDADGIDAVARDIEVAAVEVLGANGTLGVSSSLELQTLDLEVTKAVQLCPVSLTFSGGFRWARTDSELYAASFDLQSATTGAYRVKAVFDGYGPTFALDARHPLGFGRLAMFGGIRSSLMFGNNDVTVAGINNPNTVMVGRDSGLFIGEVTLGVEYTTQLCTGPQLTFRAAWEGQYWSGMPLAFRTGPHYADADSMFVEGISVAAGIRY